MACAGLLSSTTSLAQNTPPPLFLSNQLCAALQRQPQPPKGLPPSKLVQRILAMTRTVKIDKPEVAEIVELVRQTMVGAREAVERGLGLRKVCMAYVPSLTRLPSHSFASISLPGERRDGTDGRPAHLERSLCSALSLHAAAGCVAGRGKPTLALSRALSAHHCPYPKLFHPRCPLFRPPRVRRCGCRCCQPQAACQR
jgi:hypothetical protein